MKNLDLVLSRIKNALKGAFIADAASLGTHWIYYPKEMAASVPSLAKPEFKDPPTPSFYSSEEFPNHYDKAGKLSPYGEQLLFVTEYLVDTFGNSGSESDAKDIDGEDMSDKFVEFINTFGGRPDHAMKDVVANRGNEKKLKFPESGANDSQAHCFVKSLPVTCLYVGCFGSSSDLLDTNVETAIRVHQNNDMAVSYGLASSIILRSLLLEEPQQDDNGDDDGLLALQDAISKIMTSTTRDEKPKESLERVTNALSSESNIKSFEDFILDVSHDLMKDKPESPFYDLAGRSCNLPGSFLLPLYILLSGCNAKDGSSSTETLSYESAIRQNILGSGDTCGRSIMLGGIMGIVGTIPQSWIDIMDEDTMKRIDTAINKLVDIIKKSAENNTNKRSGEAAAIDDATEVANDTAKKPKHDDDDGDDDEL